jgi:hypothetical protein
VRVEVRQGKGVDDGFFEFFDDGVETTNVYPQLAQPRCNCVPLESISSSAFNIPSNVTGISSGATTSMAMVCSYVLRFNSCIRGRLPLDSVSSSLS